MTEDDTHKAIHKGLDALMEMFLAIDKEDSTGPEKVKKMQTVLSEMFYSTMGFLMAGPSACMFSSLRSVPILMDPDCEESKEGVALLYLRGTAVIEDIMDVLDKHNLGENCKPSGNKIRVL